jgi:hypothetical protein
MHLDNFIGIKAGFGISYYVYPCLSFFPFSWPRLHSGKWGNMVIPLLDVYHLSTKAKT